MRETFTVMTDTGADLPWQTAEEQGLAVAHLHYRMDQEAYAYDLGRRTDLAVFYYAMRNGAEVSTIPVLPEAFLALWEPVLQAGRDILQITIAKRLSNTFSAALSARQTLLARYPNRRILVADSCCCAVAEGMLAFEAAQMCREGKTLDETAEWIVKNRGHVNGLLLPADTGWLKKGGFLPGRGTKGLMNRQPILRLTADGSLEPAEYVKNPEDGSLALADMVKRSGYALNDQVVSVTHGDDPELANALADALRERAGCREIMILPMGPITGCYAGPGAVGAAFFGAGR